jgi:hypothetical protein
MLIGAVGGWKKQVCPVPPKMSEVTNVGIFVYWSPRDLGTAYIRKFSPKDGIISEGLMIDSGARVHKIGVGRPVLVETFDDVQTALKFCNEWARLKGGWA